jgi:hypothetical protein
MSHDPTSCYYKVLLSVDPPPIGPLLEVACIGSRSALSLAKPQGKGWSMSEHLQKAIAELEAKLQEQLKAAAKTKSGINQLAELAGLPAPYPDTEERASGGAIRPDQFYGKPLHTAMRAYLDMRGPTRGPATVNDIFDALKLGGFQFDTKSDDNAKRIIRITLTRNTLVFHKLPNGSYGLLAWYPNVKASKTKTKAKESDQQESDEDGSDIEEDDGGDDADEGEEE